MENGSSGEIPSNANEHCPGPQSESAGKADSCDGCPNQQICATAPKGPDPDSSFMSQSTPTPIASNFESMRGALKLKRNSGDIGWDYAILTSATNQERWKCLKCEKEFSGGVSRIKQHVAGIRGNIASCTKSSDEDKKKCKDAIQEAKKKLVAKQRGANIRREVHVIDKEDDDDDGCSKNSSRSLGPMDKYVSKTNPDDISLNESKGKRQQSINDALNKERNLHVSQYMARWVYETGIPFNAVDNDAFRKFVEAVGQFGPSYQPSSQYKLEPLLKGEVKRMKKARSGRHVEEVRVFNEDDFVSDGTEEEKDADKEFEFESDKDIEVKDYENEEMRE